MSRTFHMAWQLRKLGPDQLHWGSFQEWKYLIFSPSKLEKLSFLVSPHLQCFFPFVMVTESTTFNPSSRKLLAICFTWQCSTVVFGSSKMSKDVFYRRIKEAFSPWPKHGTILVVVNDLCSQKKKERRGFLALAHSFGFFKIELYLNTQILSC